MEPLTVVFVVLLILAFWIGVIWLAGRFAKWNTKRMAKIGIGVGLAIGLFHFFETGASPNSPDVAARLIADLIGTPLLLALIFATGAWIRGAMIWCSRRFRSSN